MPINVVLFSGGRGSGALTAQLVSQAGVHLTVAINGYDDGASTGAVRRFLGDSLGPSDFRKNGSRLAAELHTCDASLIALLDRRLPVDATPAVIAQEFADAEAAGGRAIAERLARFQREAEVTGRPFPYGDCAIGNLVFAGSFLLCDRDFNRAVDDYTALLGLRPRLIENVTDGADAHLVAVSVEGTFFPTEESIVAAEGSARIEDIYLVAPRLTPEEEKLCATSPQERGRVLAARSITPRLNPRLREAIDAADIIVYAPGTQHSSLFPSYLTADLAEAIGSNLRAIKLLVTNIAPDVEISGSSAVDLVDRALHYLRRKSTLPVPTPALITHYLLNDPGGEEPARPHVPLGQLDTVEDPRLLRIGNYEDALTGRHDAARVLGPFIQSVLSRDVKRRTAVLLHGGGSMNKIAQTLLEMVRGGVEAVPMTVVVFYQAKTAMEPTFSSALPFELRMLTEGEAQFQRLLASEGFDYAVLFESSGMYRGEDIVGLLSHLVSGRLDAVWGSRRLSMRDIQVSYEMRYRRNVVLGAISYIGSHLLSLAYLAMFGRYIADTLSGVRAVRASDLALGVVNLERKVVNHQLLSLLLARKADLLEVPVQFFPLAPGRVRRTTLRDGVGALLTIVRWWSRRFRK